MSVQGDGRQGVLGEIAKLFLVPGMLNKLSQQVTNQDAHQRRSLTAIEACQAQLDSLAKFLTNSKNDQQASERFGRLERLLEVLASKSACLEDASREQTLLSERRYQEHVIQPLCIQHFPLIDLCDQSIDSSPSGQEFCAALKQQLLGLLALYGVEPFRSAENSAFDPRLMKPIQRVPTTVPQRDKTVQQSLQLGFRRGELILRSESVSVFYFEPSPANEKEDSNGIRRN